MRGWVSYPLPALRETLVNAIYHRGYDVDQPEPTNVYLFPDRVQITSYPGPVPGIEAEHLLPNATVRAVPARNRRIGEFLKELGLAEGRLSGLRKVFQAMDANGSPTPQFEFDEQRTFFQATLPAHTEYAALSALRDAAHLRALGDRREAFHRVESAWQANPASAVLASEVIRAYAKNAETEKAEDVLAAFKAHGPEAAVSHVTNAPGRCSPRSRRRRPGAQATATEPPDACGSGCDRRRYPRSSSPRFASCPPIFRAGRRGGVFRSPRPIGVRADQALARNGSRRTAAAAVASPGFSPRPGRSWSASFSLIRPGSAVLGRGASWRARWTGCGHPSGKSKTPTDERSICFPTNQGSLRSWRDWDRRDGDLRSAWSTGCCKAAHYSERATTVWLVALTVRWWSCPPLRRETAGPIEGVVATCNAHSQFYFGSDRTLSTPNWTMPQRDNIGPLKSRSRTTSLRKRSASRMVPLAGSIGTFEEAEAANCTSTSSRLR